MTVQEVARGTLAINLDFICGYYEMIANCVDYAEYLAWQRENRKKNKASY